MTKKLGDFRIKEVVHADGKSHFYVQEKMKGFFKDTWRDWNDGFYSYNIKEDAENKIRSLVEIGTKYHNVEQ